MRKTLFLLSTIIVFTMITQIASAAECDKYKSDADPDYKDYCTTNVPMCDNIVKPSALGENVVRIKQIPFLNVNYGLKDDGSAGEDPADIYAQYLEELTGKSVNKLSIGTRPLEMSKYVYVETQNAIYNCAVLQVKYKIGNSILESLENNKESNIVQKIESLNENIKQEFENRNCNTLSKMQEASFKKILLDNSTYHYCNFRMYLNYLSNFPQYNIVNKRNVTSRTIRPADNKKNSTSLAENVKLQKVNMEKEVLHAKQVYNQAFYAFSELENTYGIHLMLTFIYDDYITMKNDLGRLLNPLSQLAYKIPQAQCKSGCSK